MDTAVDRLPPHNAEAEQSVLGSLLIDRDAIIRVASYVRPEDFYFAANGTVYRAILDLYNRREPTDFVTLSDELERQGALDEVGGIGYLSSLLNSVPTAVHVEYYGKIVERESTRRRLIDAGAKIVGIGYQSDVDAADALDAAAHGITLETIKLPGAKRGLVLLPRRWVVEGTFAWAARFRRQVRDYERLAEAVTGLKFAAFAYLTLNQLIRLVDQSLQQPLHGSADITTLAAQ